MVIIGQGNVSLDCARILLKDREELAKSDISPTALEVLRQLGTDLEVDIVGRRGHIQAGFTIKELRELSRLECRVVSNDEEMRLGLNAASLQELEGNRAKGRLVDLVQTLASTRSGSADAKVRLRYLLTPEQVLLDQEGAVRGVEFERTVLEGEPGYQRAVGTGTKVELPCDLLITSLGYMNVPLKDLPFDRGSNTIPHVNGRIASSPGLYVTGWLKRGPKGKQFACNWLHCAYSIQCSGIIATNVGDAKETAESVLQDIESGVLQPVKESVFTMKDSGLRIRFSLSLCLTFL